MGTKILVYGACKNRWDILFCTNRLNHKKFVLLSHQPLSAHMGLFAQTTQKYIFTAFDTGKYVMALNMCCSIADR